MSDKIIYTRNMPRRSVIGDMMEGKNAVRAYRQSPEDILLQIRRTKDIVSVTLTFEEAWRLVDTLLDALPPERPTT